MTVHNFDDFGIEPQTEIAWGITLEFLDVNSLEIDDAYQRSFKVKKSKEIAERFLQFAFAAILVGRRKDGSLHVVDGQHRYWAAIMLKLLKIPCVVFESEGRQHEASIFYQVNIKRTSVGAVDTFRAALVMGAEEAVAIDGILSKWGFRIGTNGTAWGSFSCARAIERVYSNGHLYDTMEIIFDCFAPPRGSNEMQNEISKATGIETIGMSFELCQLYEQFNVLRT